MKIYTEVHLLDNDVPLIVKESCNDVMYKINDINSKWIELTTSLGTGDNSKDLKVLVNTNNISYFIGEDDIND